MFDAVIAGGGMVGATLAIALAEQGQRVHCVDPVALPDAEAGFSPSFDARATALSLSSVWLLQRLGVWGELSKWSAPIARIHVSRQGSWGKTRLAASDIQQQAFGYVVPNLALGLALAKRWKTLHSTKLSASWGVSVDGVLPEQTQTQLTLSNGKAIATRLLVVADGARSRLREALGLSSQTIQTGQQAIVCNLQFEHQPLGLAVERFTAAGPLALLPMVLGEPSKSCKQGGSGFNLVWCGAEEQAQRAQWSDADFAAALNQAIGAGFGEVTSLSKRLVFPLNITSADKLVAARAVLIGNAAQALHPVAGQGFNLGLRDVASLLDVCNQQADLGDASLLQRYKQCRTADRALMLAMTKQLAMATAMPAQSPLAKAFGFGLVGLGQAAALKQSFTARACGLQQNLPSLCRAPAGVFSASECELV